MKLRDLINLGESKLKENNKDINGAKIILMHLLKKEKYQLLVDLDNNIDEETEKIFIDKIELLLENYPVQYVIGEEVFYGYTFKVNENVLIPRFETEELVYNILNRIDESFVGYKTIDLVDIGTGSGAIAITLKKEESRLNVVATDISNDAIEVAKTNANSLKVDIDFVIGDMIEPLEDKKFDIVVSNPPYIPEDDIVESLVKDNEPHIALFGGKNGLNYYEIILKNIHKITKDEALIAFEIGWNQADNIKLLVEKYLDNPYVEVIKDIYGKDRMMFIYKK